MRANIGCFSLTQLSKDMDTATLKSGDNVVLGTYEDSGNTIDRWHKRNEIILILGTVISLFVFVNFFLISPPYASSNSLTHLRSSMDSFIIGCLCVIVAIYCGVLARKMRANEVGSENDKLINRQKRMALFSVCLFLASDLIIISLSSPFWH